MSRPTAAERQRALRAFLDSIGVEPGPEQADFLAEVGTSLCACGRWKSARRVLFALGYSEGAIWTALERSAETQGVDPSEVFEAVYGETGEA